MNKNHLFLNKTKKHCWAVFISGHGSNLQVILDLKDKVNVSLVVSSKKNAQGLCRAKKAGVPTLVLPSTIDWDEVHFELTKKGVSRIFLAGFLKILPSHFVDLWENKILNLHPSLLPLYPGLESIKRAYMDQQVIGVTIHRVTSELDAGPIVIQKRVWTPEEYRNKSLEEVELRVHEVEHELVRKTILDFNNF